MTDKRAPRSLPHYYAVRPTCADIADPAEREAAKLGVMRIEKAATPQEAIFKAFGIAFSLRSDSWEWKDLGSRVKLIRSQRCTEQVADPVGWHTC